MRRRTFLAASLAGALCPAIAGAQQAKTYRVGVLTPGTQGFVDTPQWRAFELALREEGFVEGRNLVFEHRITDDSSRLQSLAADLVALNVDAILVRGPVPMSAAKAATKTIPIVMSASSGDPIGEGLIASFGRPGGNITGLTYAVSIERMAKQLELLKEATGPISGVAVLWDLDMDVYRRTWAPTLERAAAELGLRIMGPFQVSKPDDLAPAFAAMARAKADAVLIVAGSFNFPNRSRIAELGLGHRLPTIAAFKAFPHAGSLMSYGPDLVSIYRRVATYVAKILRGSSPGELPVENPSTYELVINLKTAQALNLAIPPALLARADEVIE